MNNYIRFTFETIEPLKITDDSSSERGQVNVLTYVPGSSIRGAIVNAFAKTKEFESYKGILLSNQISFLNAYIMADKNELMPSLKGFYEDKTEEKRGVKQIENLLIKGKTTMGNKRAELGKYCYVDGNRICYADIRMGSDMKINKGKYDEKRNVFRNQYMLPGYCFAGYIAVSDDNSGKLTNKIKNVIEFLKEENALVLGGSRSAGYGRCMIKDINEIGEMPYANYALSEETTNSVFMALLSDTSMLNDAGETVGLDEDILKEKMGVKRLKIEACSTSVVDVRGYNRTWHTWVPSSKMYGKGSVFKLSFEGESVSTEAMRNIMDEGIGIRTNEGYGRVLFMKDYGNIMEKEKIPEEKVMVNPKSSKQNLSKEEKDTLKIVAKGYYMNLISKAADKYLADEFSKKKDDKEIREKSKLTDYCSMEENSQTGAIEAILYKNLFTEDGGFEELITYLEHAKKKDADQKVQKNYGSRGNLKVYIEWLNDARLTDILEGLPKKIMNLECEEILTEKEINHVKGQLVLSEIKLINRGGGQ